MPEDKIIKLVDATNHQIGATVEQKGDKGVVATQLVDGSGNQITSFGGGTEYTEGAVDATITGSAMMFEDAGDTLAVPSLSNPLPVRIDVDSIDGQQVQLVDGSNVPLSVTDNKLNVIADLGDTDEDIAQILSQQTDGSARTIVVDGSNNAITVTGGKIEVDTALDAAVPVASAATAVPVAIVDGSGDQITSFGGGTQYTEGDTDATIVGTAIMFEGNTDDLNAVGNANPLPVSILNTDVSFAIKDGGASEANIITSGADDLDNTYNELIVGSMNYVYDGTTWDRLRGTSADGVLVNLGANNDVAITDGANTLEVTGGGHIGVELYDGFANALTVGNGSHTDALRVTIANDSTGIVNLTGTSLTALQLIDDVVYVDDADWTDNTSKHASVGGVYQSSPHTVTDGDVTPFLTDVNGRLATIVSGNVAVTNAGLTELAAAINASSQMDVNLAANGIGISTGAKQDTMITSLQLIDDAVQVLGTDTYTETTSKGITLGAVRRDADTTLVGTTNEFGPLQMDANGRLKVEAFSGEALPITDNSSSISVDWNGTQPVTGSGNATGALRVELPTNGTGVLATVGAVTAITNALPAGTNKIGDVDVAPRTTGGWSVGNFTSGDTYTALTNSAQVIKAAAGKFGGYYIYNPNSSATYVMIYNIAAASVTVGTSTATLIFCIPATSGANLELLAGIPFSTAMSIAAATTGNGNSAPATALEAMIFYV